MTIDAIRLEEERLHDIGHLEDYQMVHERHRVFPDIFEQRHHRNIIDLSAGVGVVANRIKSGRPDISITCNDISPKCLSILQANGLETVSFNLDIETHDAFPLDDNSFDVVISLATIEHLIYIDKFVSEIRRILTDEGYLYISTPNYGGITYLLPFLFSGRCFHNPLNADSRYEFYAHVRYFTYVTLVDYLKAQGLSIETVYVPIPKSSSRYTRLKSSSPARAFLFKAIMVAVGKFLSPRWASEPIICLKNSRFNGTNSNHIRKILL